VGIYAVLLEQLALAVLVGTLAIGAPLIVGSMSFTPWVIAIICYAGAAIQILGFIGVAQEKSILFRRYSTLHILSTSAAFAVAAVMIALSAAHHSATETRCLNSFFPGNDASTSGTQALGNTECNIFPWVDVGLMGGIWALLAISQIYFYTVVSGYSTFQNDFLGKYRSVYSATDIPMTGRADPWDARGSTESLTDRAGHARTQSNLSQPDHLRHSSLSEPTGAYMQAAPPTPRGSQFGIPNYSDPYYQNTGSDVSKPEQYQPHPAEGSFRRKTPRLHKSAPYNDSF